MQSGSKNPVDVARLKADIAAARIELLSAHCAADRIRLRYSPQDIVHFGERSDLFQADRIHPTAAAQPRILANVWPALQPLLTKR